MSDPFVGEIRAFPYNFVPLDWLACEGQVVSINQYQALYAVIRQKYLPAGQPESKTTFYLPNLNGAAGQVGKAMLGKGLGTGLSDYVLGQASGVNSVALGAAEQAPHSHSVTGIVAQPLNTYSLPEARVSKLSRCFTAAVIENAYSDQPNTASLHPSTLTASGATSVQAHDNMQPYQAVIFAIAMVGIFPTQP
ncbi:MAG: tail fiber protein [Gallionella sp.]